MRNSNINRITELKNSLIAQIQDSDDEEFLQALKAVLDSSEQAFQLSPEQKKAIEEGRRQIHNGEFVEGAQMFSELREWLRKE